MLLLLLGNQTVHHALILHSGFTKFYFYFPWHDWPLRKFHFRFHKEGLSPQVAEEVEALIKLSTGPRPDLPFTKFPPVGGLQNFFLQLFPSLRTFQRSQHIAHVTPTCFLDLIFVSRILLQKPCTPSFAHTFIYTSWRDITICLKIVNSKIETLPAL